MGGDGADPGVGNLGWLQIGAPATSWVVAIISRIISSRTAFLVTYEAVVLVHVISTFDQG